LAIAPLLYSSILISLFEDTIADKKGTRRIDILLFGKNASSQENIVLIELKQWSNENVDDCKTEGNVLVNFGQGKKEHVHPSLQVEGYHYDLKNFMAVFEEKPIVSLSSCSYCHNYSKLNKPVLYSPRFKRCIEEFPLFSKEDIEALGGYLQERLAGGAGLEVFNRFINSPIKPSKKLLEHTKEMINKQQIFNMIDDQLTAYDLTPENCTTCKESLSVLGYSKGGLYGKEKVHGRTDHYGIEESGKRDQAGGFMPGIRHQRRDILQVAV
jgi:uncharacterized protein